MKIIKALNIAVGCVMTSHLEMKEKQEVINKLRIFENSLQEVQELIEYREYGDDEIIEMIGKLINR